MVDIYNILDWIFLSLDTLGAIFSLLAIGMADDRSFPYAIISDHPQLYKTRLTLLVALYTS